MTISTQQVHPVHPEDFSTPSLAPELSLVPASSLPSSDSTSSASRDLISVQLPAELAQVFRAAAGDELNDFASYALTRFMLREHWVELEDCALLPFVVQMTNDVVDYQLAPDAETAIAQAEDLGDETALQVELDLGLTVVEVFED
jgi:hypothetical protein